MITLEEVTSENLRAIVELSENIDDELVAPNNLSIAEWLLRDDAWLRAIYAGGNPVGLVMVQDIPDWHVYHVWRLMVGSSYQGKGYGREAMEQVIARYKRRPGAYVITTFVAEKEGNAERFYNKLGFERDGRRQMDQIGMALKWGDPPGEDEWPSIPTDPEITLETVHSGMLRTINRIYQSLPEGQLEGLPSPCTLIAMSRLDEDQDEVRAICANGYPVGFAICDPQDGMIKASYIAAPYQELEFEARVVDAS
jgi:diamine N-acetyltransferase